MNKQFSRYKFLAVIVFLIFLLGNTLLVTSRTIKISQNTSSINVPSLATQLDSKEEKASVPSLMNPVNNETIEEGITPVGSVPNSELTETISSEQVSFGPYNEENSIKGHAYEPFREENEKKDSSKDLGYRKDRLLIKYKNSVKKEKDGSYSVKGNNLALSKQGIKKLEPLLPEMKVSSTNAKKTKMEEKLANWHKATIEKGKDINKVVKELKKDSNIESVEYDYIRSIDETTSSLVLNDENMNQQWHLENSGVKQAWEYLNSQGMNPGGNRDVVVAVIDTGVDYNHPDLKGNMWINTGETPNNGIDDDQNGFVDDIYGATTEGNQYAGESGNPTDDNGHGTHVAGIIAGQGNNNIGGVGVAYNTRIMAIKAAQSSGVLSSSDVAQAIYYAVDKGADVINMSFGGYGRSTVEEDALQVAFGTSVLVAAAGNDSTPNLPHTFGKDMYPAAYNWVLGVMAEGQYTKANGDYLTDFSNWDFKAQDSHEYEVMAPGADIYSTLPNGQYAKWSGTSMAAPVVSGIAALARSKFSDKESYSSRFIMGQIAETGQVKQGITYDPNKEPLNYKSVNALSALTNTPKPKLSYLEHYIFDKATIAPENDGDGVVDAGETVDLAMIIRNHWGKADNVRVKIDTNSHAGIADPYVTVIQDTVDYGAVGTFATDDNGLIYENDMVTGVNLPFKLNVSPNTPNDHVVSINVTITGTNGYDIQDTQTYSFTTGFSFMVRNGVELPGVIDKDMTLTKDKYWIVPNSTLIQEGATVTVEPGTQIQFWSTEGDDPYAEKTMAYIEVRGKFLVNGTAEEPVEMFPSSMYQGYEVKVYSTNYLNYYGDSSGYRGYAEINYARIMNPNIAIQKVNHSYFSQDLFNVIYKRYLYEGEVRTTGYYGAIINADVLSNSRFVGLGSNQYNSSSPSTSSMFNIKGNSKGNLFDSSFYYMDEARGEDNVYLKNYKYSYGTYWVSKGKGFGTYVNQNQVFQTGALVKNPENGSTYVQVFPHFSFSSLKEFNIVESYANSLGGHIVTIDDSEENQFLQNYFGMYNSIIGLNDYGNDNVFKWASGDEVNYTNWREGEPNNKSSYGDGASIVRLDPYSGKWYDDSYSGEYTNGNESYIIEIPGIANVTGVSLNETSFTLGAGGGQYQLIARISPAKADNPNVTWNSSNPEVATVDQNGFVTPLSVGNTTITVTTEDGGFTASAEVNVIQIVPATGITINKESIELTKGQQEILTATVLPENSTDKRVKWSSSNESIATVDSNGKVTGISNGNATITVTSEDGGFSASTSVSVIVPVEGISLNTEYLRLVLGDSPVNLIPDIQPEGATNKNVIWSSSNKAVVEVDENGAVTPVGKGTAKITVTTVNGGYSATSVITVWDENVSFNTTSISAGYSHSLALNEDGSVWGWGYNGSGQLGDGTYNNRLTPVKALNLTGIVKVEAGNSNSFAIDNLGNLWNITSNPYIVSNMSNVKDIALGDGHVIVLKNDGTVWAWGNNYSGQLGDGTTIHRYEPIQVPNLTNVVSIDAGSEHTVALTSDGKVWAWGRNYYGQLGDGTNRNNRLSPVQVKNLTNVKDISAGDIHTIALKNDGTVWGWGYGGYGQIGNYYSETFTPEQVQGLSDVIKISAGGYNSAVLKSDNTVWTFGYNENGQLGNDTATYRATPKQIEGLEAKDISVGQNHTNITRLDGTVWSWGYNFYGQLGNLTTENVYTPVQTLFGILPDTQQPSLVATSPSNNETGLRVDSDIRLTFDEGIKPGDNYPLITLRDQNNNIISLKSKMINNNVLILEPINDLQDNTNYTVSVPANSIKDVFDNPYYQDIYLNFSTASMNVTSSLLPKLQTRSSYNNLMKLLENFRVPINSEGTTKLSAGSVLAGSTNMEPAEIKQKDNQFNSFTPQNTLSVSETQESPEITQSFIEEKRLEFINTSGALSTITNNAILNRWWDPNVEHWMRFTSETGELNKRFIANNYWGTTSTELIEKALVHFNDFRNMEEIIYKPILTAAPETAYPFVTDIYVSTETQERATKVGAENIQVHVLFNRDMDQSKQPQVSFGPDMPTTDYTINGVNGGWISPRHWVGSMKISALTGDGYQFFRVAGAVAADDPWLVTGNDTERFRFEIVTSGTEAMNLQASGGEGKVHLSWTQDDFDTLAGYNIYRSDTKDGSYTKINKSLIPSDQKSFDDTNVTPGKIYYYKFTVVKTDLTESDFSNIASAAPIDTIIPVITHTPIQQVNSGQPVQFFADVTDNVKVDKVTLFYKASTETAYKQKEMVNSTNSRYSTTLEGANVLPPWIDYYIEATDGSSKALYGNQNQPYRIMVSDKPTITSVSPVEGPESGGTNVIINGANFKQGASVLFGQAVASNVVVDSANQITAVAPAHYPAKVDITVNNPDGTSGIILGAYTYVSEGKEVAIPNITGNVGDIIEVPVNVANVSGLRSADFKVKYDPNLLSVQSVSLGNLTKNFSLASNINNIGEVQLSMASSTAVNGSGSIALITFKVLDSDITSSVLVLDQLSFNSGSIKVVPVNGNFSIVETYNVQGNVRYYSNYKPVNNVLLELIGNLQYKNTTDVNGAFTLSGIRKGSYTLKASKTDEINGISSFDASLVLQYSAGLITLNDNEKIAADVDGNRQINALDAAYILEKSVDLFSLPFPGVGKVWTFLEGERKYDNLASDQSYQNFTGILIGDVNGDWGTAETNMSTLYTLGDTSVQSDGKFTAPVEFNIGDADLYSAKISIAYDPKQVKPSSVDKTETTQDYSVVYNQVDEGVLEIAIAGSRPLKGSGKLLDLKFEPIVKKLRATNLQLQEGTMNDESIVIKALMPDKDNNQNVKTKVKWKAEALGEDLTYSWILYKETKAIARQGYSKQNYFESTLKEPGTYRVLMMVKDKNGKVVSKFSENLTVTNSK